MKATIISIALAEEQYKKLQERAVMLGITPEELVRIGVEELLHRPQEDFQDAMDYVMNKNADLYRRLS